MSLSSVTPVPSLLSVPCQADADVVRLRQSGFPVYGLTLDAKFRSLRSLLGFNRSGLIADMNVRQSMHGLPLAWSYFPHAWAVRCADKRTPLELFFGDDLFPSAVKKCRHLHGNITDSTVRKTLRSYSGTQSVSNFRPTAAAAIYDRYLPDEGGTVWDMSAGFGGRLLGAVACRKVKKYIGTDPSTLTMEGLREMKREVIPMAARLGRGGIEVELHQRGSEDFVPSRESLDVCFTSPPYGPGHERYSDEPTQSYMKFSTPEEWLHGFMKQTLANCHVGLKPEGKLVINLANTSSYPELERDFVAMAEANGWRLVETLSLCLSKMVGTRNGTDTFKTEPVFVFAKVDGDSNVNGAADTEPSRELFPVEIDSRESVALEGRTELSSEPALSAAHSPVGRHIQELDDKSLDTKDMNPLTVSPLPVVCGKKYDVRSVGGGYGVYESGSAICLQWYADEMEAWDAVIAVTVGPTESQWDNLMKDVFPSLE